MLKEHPRGLMTLFFTEMWERFGFYTIMAVFVLYMDEVFGWSDAQKGQIYGLFVGFVYFMPILGGWIADKFLGYRRTIMIGAVILGFGYLLLGFSGVDRVWLFFTALVVMVLGNGLFKANISVLVGNLYEEGSALKDVGYNIFYMGINIGATVAPLAATALHNFFGNYNSTFFAASAGMVCSLLIFYFWRHNYLHAEKKQAALKAEHAATEPTEFSKKEERQRILALAIVFFIVIFFWMAFYQGALTFTLFAQRSVEDRHTITQTEIADWNGFQTASLSDSIPLTQKLATLNLGDKLTEKDFSALNNLLKEPDLFYRNKQRVQQLSYEKIADHDLKREVSVLGIFTIMLEDNEKIAAKASAASLDKMIVEKGGEREDYSNDELRDIRIVNRELLSERYPQIKQGWVLLNPETYQAFNPLFIVLLTPVIVLLFNWLRKQEKEPSSLGKIGIGMFTTGITVLIMVFAALLGGNADANNMAPYWLIVTYFMMTISELLLSPIGLSLVSKVAPPRLRGTMMGFWFGATATGSYLSGLIGSFYDDVAHSLLFGMLVVVTWTTALAVWVFLKKAKFIRIA